MPSYRFHYSFTGYVGFHLELQHCIHEFDAENDEMAKQDPIVLQYQTRVPGTGYPRDTRLFRIVQKEILQKI